MRAMFLVLGLLILGGCATSSKHSQCTECGDSPQKATLLQRLGFGRPIGQSPTTTEVATPHAYPLTTLGSAR
jgi:hypothetical protein